MHLEAAHTYRVLCKVAVTLKELSRAYGLSPVHGSALMNVARWALGPLLLSNDELLEPWASSVHVLQAISNASPNFSRRSAMVLKAGAESGGSVFNDEGWQKAATKSLRLMQPVTHASGA